jgi:hypothetical protein
LFICGGNVRAAPQKNFMDEIDEINAEIKEIHDNDNILLDKSSFSSGNFLEDQAEFLDSIGLKAKAKF